MPLAGCTGSLSLRTLRAIHGRAGLALINFLFYKNVGVCVYIHLYTYECIFLCSQCGISGVVFFGLCLYVPSLPDPCKSIFPCSLFTVCAFVCFVRILNVSNSHIFAV